VVFAVHYFATHRIAVYVYIGGAHKDGYLEALFLEIFVVVSFFNNDHFTITGRNDLAIINRELPVRNPEKRNNKNQQGQGYQENEPAEDRSGEAYKIK
jgi:hypothetical protein